jgi:hypothetical protein
MSRSMSVTMTIGAGTEFVNILYVFIFSTFRGYIAPELYEEKEHVNILFFYFLFYFFFILL